MLQTNEHQTIRKESFMENGGWLQYASKKKLQTRHDAKVRRFHKYPDGKVILTIPAVKEKKIEVQIQPDPKDPQKTVEVKTEVEVVVSPERQIFGKRTPPKGHKPCAECPPQSAPSPAA